jgi:FlaA1/EpsC-like NDP-sugar epimerase
MGLPSLMKLAFLFPTHILARRLLLAGSYVAILGASLLGAFLLRFDFDVPPEFWIRFRNTIIWLLPLKLVALALAGQFRTLLTYFSLPDAKHLAIAMGVSGLVALMVWFALGGAGVVPRGVIVTDTIVSFLGLCVLRTGLRVFREKFLGVSSAGVHRRPTAIIGSGGSAALLLREIQSRPGLGLDVVCFIDDDRQKIGSTLHGIPVVGPRSRLSKLAASLGLEKVIIAMPKARPALLKEIVSEINSLGLEHDILPSFAQMLHGDVTVSHLRPVEPSDLLGREEASLDEEGIGALLAGQSVMVTGAGGSIGSELCRQLAARCPEKIILVERSEPALFSIEQELRRTYPSVRLVPRAFDVRDEMQMTQLFCTELPNIVFQAAAHKHVPLMEEQPAEAFLNNVLGTAVVARLAKQHGTSKFILVSSDKAVKPSSVMGITKRLAEIVLQEMQICDGGSCRYAAVRFGNVLGSSGSVVPIFRRQIAEGGPVTVTDREATRYFMSIPEAVGLILQSAWQSQGGEIFVLDMGEPIPIDFLARQMIELSGFKPEQDIRIIYTGLRPGEKLHEESVGHWETAESSAHPRVKVIRRRTSVTGGTIESLLALVSDPTVDEDSLRRWLSTAVAEFC